MDLIDRQAAIDAMCSACGYDCDKSKFVYNAPQDEQVIMCPEHYALSTLPSAQPEAKPPKWVAEDRYIKNRFAVFPHCPQCNADVITGQCYCMICGQHIDWSEDDG